MPKKSKKSGSNPDLAWTMEPEEGFQDGPSDAQLSASMPVPRSPHYNQMNGGPQPWLQGGGAAPGGGERLQPLTREDDTAFILQQAAEAQSNRKGALMQSWDGIHTPPMGQKRSKKDKKKDKKDKKDLKISSPLNVRHFGMPSPLHLGSGSPLPEQSNFTVEHLATMPVEGQLSHVSPYESIRKVRDLIQRGDIWTREVILAITSSDLIIKEGATGNSLTIVPLSAVVKCDFLQDTRRHSNILMVCSQDPRNPQPKMHFFQCARAPAENICNEIQLAARRHRHLQQEEMKKWKKGNTPNQDLSQNWILEPKLTSPPPQRTPTSPPSQAQHFPFPPPPPSHPPPPPSHPPPPPQPQSQTPVLPPHGGTHATDGAAVPQASHSPAPGDPPLRRLSHSATDSQLYTAASNRAEAIDTRDDVSIGSTDTQRQKKIGDFVTRASSKYIGQVHAKAASGKTDPALKKTMKASRIQRDVDILNHVFDDMERFMKLLKDKSAAWNDLEKKMKKSKRKKHDAALEALKRKAEPPSEQEFTETYRKCKYGINLISKLGHHLSSPSPTELLRGIFGHIKELVHLNKGPQLAASVVSPLFTKTAFDFMTRKLTPKETTLWNQLGANWLITIEQWPSTQLPPDYEIQFSDGCIPPNLHNASDCPANFPTLASLPREQRPSDYSDAYDGDQPEAESTGLMINPAVAAVVASKAAMVTSPILPGVVVTGNRRPSDASLLAQQLHQAHTSQISLTSVGSHETNEAAKTAKALFDYQATTLEELSIRRGEKVEIVNDSHNWWLVKNFRGRNGYLPSNLLEIVTPRRRGGSRADTRQADDPNVVHFHGRNVPAPPKNAPPPVPSPLNGRRPSVSSKHSPQHQSAGRKASHLPQRNLSTVVEVSESRTSTVSRPNPPGLPPPPPFSPAPPPQSKGSVPPAPPPPGAPPPPPPPPVVALPQQKSLSEMVQQHKLKAAKEGKSQKKKLHEQDRPIDIAAAMKNRKPLRKTSTATTSALEGVVPGASMQSDLEKQLRSRKLSTTIEEPDTGAVYRVLPWNANNSEVKQWLIDQGYGGSADKVNVFRGKSLYQMSRDELRDVCGVGDGVRLFSQLQRDKAQAEKEGGDAKESDFQKLMRQRKTKADQPDSAEPVLLGGGWGRSKESRGPLTERETVVDDTFNKKGNVTRRGRTRELDDNTEFLRRKAGAEIPTGRNGYSRDDRRSSRYRDEDRRERNSYYEKEGGRRYRNSSEGDGREEERSKRRSRRDSRSGAYSDDEGYHRKKTHGKERRRSIGRSKKRQPTNIDDFDEDDLSGFETDTESESYSSDYSDSDSSGSKGRGRRRKLRSSASASLLTNAEWALGEGSEVMSIDKRIKMQQAEIKRQLSSLAQLQKDVGLTSLPAQQQKILHQDLQKLEQVQTRLKDKPGNQSLQMQLIGQQMLLCEHLKEVQMALNPQKLPSLGLSLAQNPSAQKLQMIQQQQQILAEQQRQLYTEQQRKLEAEQQYQLAVAAEQQYQLAVAAEQQRQEAQRQMMLVEQQRQMQLAQLAQLQTQQQLQSPQQVLVHQQPFTGAVGMQVYNPYTTAMGYY